VKLSAYERRVLAVLAAAAIFLCALAVILDHRSVLNLSIVEAREAS
jgi:hypothetical protein